MNRECEKWQTLRIRCARARRCVCSRIRRDVVLGCSGPQNPYARGSSDGLVLSLARAVERVNPNDRWAKLAQPGNRTWATVILMILMQSGVCSAAGERDSQSSIAEQQAVTPDTSFGG
jgi:hypothetical protein